LRLPLRI